MPITSSVLVTNFKAAKFDDGISFLKPNSELDLIL